MNVAEAVALAVLVLAITVSCVNGERNITVPWGPRPRRTYSLEFQAMHKYPEEMSKEYIHIKSFRLSRYNATNKIIVMEANLVVLKDLPLSAMISFEGHEKMASNKYSYIPVGKMKRNLCDYIENDYAIYYDLLKHSNLSKSCPVTKGDYYIKDYLVNEYYLPPELPGSLWRVFWIIEDEPRNGKIIFKISFDIRLDNPYPVPPEP